MPMLDSNDLITKYAEDLVLSDQDGQSFQELCRIYAGYVCWEMAFNIYIGFKWEPKTEVCL